MAAERSNLFMVEERMEPMVPPIGGGESSNQGATLQLAHFLTPSLNSGDSPNPPASSSNDLQFSFRKDDRKNLRVEFHGWRSPPKDWKSWTDRMHSLHHSAWERAGIRDAILNSTYQIHRIDEIIYGFAEKWCPDTNSFMFPWGEATITLEDVMIIGGYSVLGGPVFEPLADSESEKVEKTLISARIELVKTPARKATQGIWLQKFMNSGSEIEHEAFLALWLSRFVFPPKTQDATVEKHVFPAAIHLAKGTKMALAPAFLANLYAHLSMMKGALVTAKRPQNSRDCKQDNIFKLSITAPFQLVQIWVWERFLTLRPNDVTLKHDLPRFAIWNDLRMNDIGDVKLAIDESAEIFLWRPYSIGCKGSFPQGIYKEAARRMMVGSGMDQEQEILVRLLRASELVGIDSDCIEQYLPHRVAMQFGFDQDVPGPVARANSDKSVAWGNYTREIRNGMLYVPPRLYESDVTARYMEWWKNCLSAWNGEVNLNLSKELKQSPQKTELASINIGKSKQNDGPEQTKLVGNTADKKGKAVSMARSVTASQVRSQNNSFVPVGFVFSRERNHNDSLVPPGFGSHQTKLFGNADDKKGKVPNIVRSITASEYKRALAIQLRPGSTGRRMLQISCGNESGRDELVPFSSRPNPETNDRSPNNYLVSPSIVLPSVRTRESAVVETDVALQNIQEEASLETNSSLVESEMRQPQSSGAGNGTEADRNGRSRPSFSIENFNIRMRNLEESWAKFKREHR